MRRQAESRVFLMIKDDIKVIIALKVGSTISSLVAKYQVAQTGVTTPVRSRGGKISNLVKSVQTLLLIYFSGYNDSENV